MLRTLAVLPLLAALPAPKPVFIQIDGALRGAWLIAECTIDDVELANPMGADGKLGKITATVTNDPARIVRGFDRLGETLELLPSPSGRAQCSGDLATFVEPRTKVLLVVTAKREVVLVGRRDVVARDRAPPLRYYWLRGYCDYNACIVHADADYLEIAAAKAPPGEKLPWKREIAIAAGGMFHHLRDERQPILGRVARFTVGERPALSAAEINQLVFECGDAKQRQAAEQTLVAHGRLAVGDIRAARNRTRHTAVAASLDRVLRALHDFVIAERIAAAKAVPLGEARLLVEALPALSAEIKLLAEARVRALLSADLDGIEAWRDYLGLPAPK